MVSFLTPVLGLYGINVKEFINDFEAKTKFINFDIVIPTTVRISKIKTFEILLKPRTWFHYCQILRIFLFQSL